MASLGVGGMKGRPSARARTTGGKIAGKLLAKRAKDLLFRSAFSACQLDMRLPLTDDILTLRRKTFVHRYSLCP